MKNTNTKNKSRKGRQPIYDYSRCPQGLTHDQLYSTATNMISRCLDSKNHPAYANCAVCEDWQLHRQHCIDWICDNWYSLPTGEAMEIDKDILVKGNRVYSPTTCCFVPRTINKLFMTNRLYPIPRQNANGTWIITDYHLHTWSGINRNDVITQYIADKQKEIAEVAERYKGMIPTYIYEAIKNWRLEIEDWNNRSEAA